MAKTRKKAGATDERWMTLPEAARALGQHRQTVLNRANAGELESLKIGTYTFIARADVDRLRTEQAA